VLGGVQVDYDADRISFEQLVRTFWKYVNPTQTDGQFSEKGAQYTTAVWVTNEKERAFVEECMVGTRRCL
jgi:peptide methionine sulfoxide reductase MsrA